MKGVLLFGIIVLLVTGCGGKRKRAVVPTPAAQETVSASIRYQMVSLADTLVGVAAPGIWGGTDTLALGRLCSGEKVERVFELHNSGANPFVVIAVMTDCGCTTADFPREPIKGNESVKVTLFYDSAGQFGAQLKTLRILTSLRQEPYTIFVTANVTD